MSKTLYTVNISIKDKEGDEEVGIEVSINPIPMDLEGAAADSAALQFLRDFLINAENSSSSSNGFMRAVNSKTGEVIAEHEIK